MKYMMLMQYSAAGADFPNIASWTADEVRAHVAFMRDYNAKLVADGEFVDAQGLASPATARIVRAGADGAPVVTDGPFPETKEWLAGYWIVDVETERRALELAAAASAAPGPQGEPLNMPIEVRPIGSEPEV
ncbi:YciI family protein [Actinomadura rayongensis]|uniref:YCII-related domain-containing protein n=1 Tax=Actinomadura rayongensis TaxID=1429076 RepID=A0A6I4W4M6_9ACTN|nr:YciI family protein [Actinomadura rayongensis]MXQ65137.1 hypothetical protein [Actinomadura rayongensis]